MHADIIATYFADIEKTYKTGQTTESSYRPALSLLFSQIEDDVTPINEPKGVKVGRPDFVFVRGKDNLTVGHCEAKDINLGVLPKELKGYSKEQFQRYSAGLPNLLYTNGLDFVFFKNGELVHHVSIGEILMGLQPKPDQFPVLANLLKDFAAERLQTITSAERLAKLMAGKAQIVKDVLFNSLKEDKELTSELAGQFKAFQEHLIHDLSLENFADIYAETVAYGMFGARLHDPTLNDFSRQEALELLPKSNPFLKKLFEYIAGAGLDDPVRRTIDELAEVFQASDPKKLMAHYFGESNRKDPFIHFYATFLAEYNPKKRKARGVWYTPEPVVNFIVRAVDDVLKTEFGLKDGLADNSKVTLKQSDGQGGTVNKAYHRVQILDPAVGTGTFLAEVIHQIAPRIQGIAPGMWSSYVEKELIPRLHGFELIMASYAMCHLKLEMMLTEMGYKPTSDHPPRMSVYLTNSLEEGETVNQELPFAQWLSNEARAANEIKTETPIMCIIGNPPYSGESANKGDWIMGLMEAYKKEPGGVEKLKERNPKWINDDYVKFIRFSEHLIEKNGEGVLAFITNHGYLDNPSFRSMRWHLLKTFDKIHVLDLHGNTKKREVAPDGSVDKNVFDIQQGVAIIIAVKKKGTSPDKFADVFHDDLWGARKEKYNALNNGTIPVSSLLESRGPQYEMVPRDYELQDKYNKLVSLKDLFNQAGNPAPGGVSTHDQFAISFSKPEQLSKLKLLIESQNEIEARRHYRLCSQAQWSYEKSKHLLKSIDAEEFLIPIDYRPFDRRWTVNNENVFVHRRERLNLHLIEKKNYVLVSSRQGVGDGWANLFIGQDFIDDCFVSNRTKERTYGFSLYLYPDETSGVQTDALAATERTVNMDSKIRKAIEDSAEHPKMGRPDEVAIFDYIYGVLHCPAYRETYAEFLKIDFPRVPYPSSPDAFWDISAKGTVLRRLHLMEEAAIGETPFPLTGEGEPVVDITGTKSWALSDDGKTGTVSINERQAFVDVPLVAWEFYIGGYQPAQKWLKDRKGRVLTFDDIRHYMKIIKILTETDRIMKTIEMDLN